MVNGWTRGVELGVSTGRFTCFLCAHNPQLHMTAVDLWAPQPEKPGLQGYLTFKDWNHEQSYRNFSKLTSEHFPGRVDIKRMDTVEAASHVEDKSLDFVFVDADHSYEACKKDIQAWLPKVKPGGIMTGHDLDWPTVRQAVEEIFKGHVIFADHVWGVPV